MPQRSASVLGLLGLVVLMGLLPAQEPPARPQSVVDYNRDVRPILAKNCFSCHGQDEGHRAARLRLDVREGAIAELKSGHIAVVPGKPEESELLRRVSSDVPQERMPPEETGTELSREQIDVLRRWILQGAVYAPHWSFVPPRQPSLPAVKAAAWPRNPIDHFVLAELEARGLRPSPEADRFALLRRVSLDLRGLPPTPEELEAFAVDQSPAAYEKVVDRYLNDPAFGERWARMWLDLARYADSAGYGSDPLRTIWRYRDWVIDAFNRNLPYDQFTIEQLAGDLLPNATLDQKIATAFHRNTMTNTEGGTDDEEFRIAAVKDRVDTTIQVWMGLTMGCAKCHSHKYDPITQAEYYRFFAIFNQTADNDQPGEQPVLQAPTLALQLQIERIDRQIAGLKQRLDTPTPELARAQAEWEASLKASSDWVVLSPDEARSAGGATLKILPDSSILAQGTNPATDVYTIEATTELKDITGFRLEAIPDPSLPNQGAGRAADGNFVLGRFAVTAAPVDASSNSPRGRFIRIEIPGEGRILSLAEVQVLSQGNNLALQGEATQSSTDYDGPAKLAIDGNTNGHYFEAKSTTHTATEANPWWEVKLPVAAPIDQIVIWNRTDGGVGVRLANFRVSMLDDSRKVVWQMTVAQPPSPKIELSPGGRQTVSISQVVADYSQDGFPVASVIAPKPGKGWAVGPHVKQPHTAVFAAAVPLASSGQRLSFRLEHHFNQAGFNLGRFRLSATTDRRLIQRAAVPAEVLAIVDRPVEQRTPEQSARLAQHYRTIAPALKPLRDEIARLEKSRPKAPTVPVMQELPAAQRRLTHVLVKGNHLVKGEPVEPGVPAAFHQLPADAKPDRLVMAHWLLDERNPLTARVAVNRLWAQLWGTGLVVTEEDWGTQGEMPSHPELLDWLALEYRRLGWDTKALLRVMVTSAAYRQSSRATPELLAADPTNRLFTRGPRFRLEAEMVRDQALAFSGLLSRTIGGPSVYPPQPPGLWQAAFNGERTWATSTGPDRYRRGLYTFWRRTVPYPSMATFDATSRETCTVRRIRTNTPLQAFVTLNDPVYVEAAQALARRIIQHGGNTPEARAAFVLQLCLCRPATADQAAELTALYRAEFEHFRKRPEDARKLATEPLGALPADADAAEYAAWTVVANVVLNLDGVLTRG